MKANIIKFGIIAVAVTSTVPITQTAFAQTRGNAQETQYSFIPYTAYGYVGGNLGRSDYKGNHCEPGFSCDDSDIGGKLYVGGKINKALGIELGYINLGKFDRNGGEKKAQGADVHLLGNVPLTDVFNVYLKAGGVYGWTHTTAATPAVATGSEKEFNWSYGAGLQYDVNPAWAVRADWDQYRLKYTDRRDNVGLYSVGAIYKY